MAAVLIIAGSLLGAAAAGLCDYRAGMAVAAVELVVAGVDMARDLPTQPEPREGVVKEMGRERTAGPDPDE